MALDKLTKVQSVGISSFIQVVGVVTATGGFVGDLTGNVTGIITATGDFSIADKIVHTGDTNTALRFPAADTFTVETGGSERFRIDSTGNTLIYGVLRKDNVNSSLSISGGNGADSSANIVLHGSSGSPANVTQFRTGSTERLRITSSGVKQVKNGNLNIYQTYIDFSGDISTPTTAAAIFRPADNTLAFSTVNAERLRITSGGSVGFNTTLTQSSKTVHIAGDYRTSTQNVADEGLIFQSFATASTGNVYPGISWTGNPGALGRARAAITAVAINDNNGSDLVFLTRNQADGTELDVTDDEKVRITSSGRVGIATAVPSYRLDIGDGATDPPNGYQLRVNANGDYIFALQRQSVPSFSIRNNSTGIVHLNTQNSKILSLGVSSGNASGSIEDDVRIDSNGHLTVQDGNLVIGTSGHGIDFSADGNASGMTSELLDDYEEGNFTPIVRGRTTAGTASYGRTAVGKYTKVGRMVDVMVDMVFSGANGNGNLEIAGLPFAAHSGPYVRFAGDVTLLTAGISWSNQIACYINDTNSHFWMTNTPTSGNYAFVNINSNTTEILLHCTYMVS